MNRGPVALQNFTPLGIRAQAIIMQNGGAHGNRRITNVGSRQGGRRG